MCACVYLSDSLCARARSVWYTLKWVITSLLRQINVRLTHRKLDHLLIIKHHHDLKRECVCAWVRSSAAFPQCTPDGIILMEKFYLLQQKFPTLFLKKQCCSIASSETIHVFTHIHINAAALLLQKKY